MTTALPPAPLQHQLDCDGLSMACFEWRPEQRGLAPTLLCVHATGFHARVWDQTIAHLPPWHVIAVDQRGHGRSDKPPIDGWAPFGRDLAAGLRTLNLRNVHGVGHSMGGHALVQAAAFEPERFARLTLIDPVIASPAAYHAPAPVFPGGMHPAARRRARFDSVQDMIGRFAERMPYRLFTAPALRDYCEHGVLPAAQGEGVELACSPLTEAQVYMTGRANAGVYASVRALQIPVQVLRAKQPTPDRDPFDYSFSPTWPELAGEFRLGQDVPCPEHSHFLPMEDPALVARLIQRFQGT